MKPKPVHEVRIGTIKAAIWRNETAKGVHHHVTFCRLYHDAEEWHSTDSFGRDDLLVLAKVADKTHSWIYQGNNGTIHGPLSTDDEPGEHPPVPDRE